jgi:hypothetical protein
VRQGRELLTPRIGYSTQLVPGAGNMRIHERLVPVGAGSVTVAAGEPLATFEQARTASAKLSSSPVP